MLFQTAFSTSLLHVQLVAMERCQLRAIKRYLRSFVGEVCGRNEVRLSNVESRVIRLGLGRLCLPDVIALENLVS